VAINNLTILTVPWLQSYPELRAGFTTRYMGNGLDPLSAFLHIKPEALISLKQIHSKRVIAYGKAEPTFPLQEGDALISKVPGIVLAVRTADCVPVLLYDPRGRVSAAVHAGWRGIEAGIIEETLSRLTSDYGSRPEDVIAAIGPAICQSCFEIGPEVAGKLVAKEKACPAVSVSEKLSSKLNLYH
jgi:YfiH family protein